MFLESHLNRKDIPLNHLNYLFICDFENFLRNHRPLDHHQMLGNNAIMKHLERLRKLTNLAVRMEWIDKNPFAAYRLKFKKVHRDCLTEEELEAIENKELKIERLRYASLFGRLNLTSIYFFFITTSAQYSFGVTILVVLYRFMVKSL